MAFIFGLVVGIIVGLVVIVGFVKCENSRSKLRSKLATTIAAFARMTVEDSRKILPAEVYPSWVVFSQRQKLSTHFFLCHHPSCFSYFLLGLTFSFWFFFTVGLVEFSPEEDLALCWSGKLSLDIWALLYLFFFVVLFPLKWFCVLNLVVQAASELVKSSVEPTLEQYRPAVLASLKFSKFTLGTVAPQFTG